MTGKHYSAGLDAINLLRDFHIHLKNFVRHSIWFLSLRYPSSFYRHSICVKISRSTGWAIFASSPSYLEREIGAVNACMCGLYMLHLSILFSWIVSPCRGTGWAVLLSLSMVPAIELYQKRLSLFFFFPFCYSWLDGFDCKAEHLYPAHPVLNLENYR